MIVDAHVHLYPDEVGCDPAAWAGAMNEPKWSVLATRRRRDGRPVQGFPTVAELLREMDAAGIDRAVLLGWYWENAATCAGQNRFYARNVQAHPDRLSAFATVQPTADPAAVAEEIRRAQGEGLIGIGELSPHALAMAADDPRLTALFALAGERRLPVNLHVTDPASRPFPGRVDTPLADFVTWARAHPRTTFVLAHWAGGLPLLEAAASALPNVYVDTAAAPILYGAEGWTRFLPALGADRVLFGSDHPLDLYPKSEAGPNLARFVVEAKTAGVPEAVLGGNARRLLGL